MYYFGGDSYCQACGSILPSAARDRNNEDERKRFWREKYAPLGIDPSSDLLERLGSIREGVICPFCEENFGKPEHEVASFGSTSNDYELERAVEEDFGVDEVKRDELLRRFMDSFFQLKMHLILLHDNPTRLEADRTNEDFWGDVLGFMDVRSGISRRVFLWEIMRVWKELGGPGKKKGI